jgi:hypothetical protein
MGLLKLVAKLFQIPALGVTGRVAVEKAKDKQQYEKCYDDIHSDFKS